MKLVRDKVHHERSFYRYTFSALITQTSNLFFCYLSWLYPFLIFLFYFCRYQKYVLVTSLSEYPWRNFKEEVPKLNVKFYSDKEKKSTTQHCPTQSFTPGCTVHIVLQQNVDVILPGHSTVDLLEVLYPKRCPK